MGRNQELRFIPTCVGNGSRSMFTRVRVTVHPHVCGERFENLIMVSQVNGSSPRVWGTVACPGRHLLSSWFIPTCVGNGRFTTWIAPWLAVHPHVCGER